MSRHRCQDCGARVRRAIFCSRCGARQPRRVLRALVAGVGASALAAAFVVAFGSLGRSEPEFNLTPSGGQWAGEEDIGPLDLPPELPSPFAPQTREVTPAATPSAR